MKKLFDGISSTAVDPHENSISKSQRKRESLALQEIGEQLVALPDDAIKKMDIPENLRQAVVEAKRIPQSKHGGFKRQMQYIGRIMRSVDAEPISAQLAARLAPSRQDTAIHHLAEQWRTKLFDEPDSVAAFAQLFPTVDRALLDRNLEKAKWEQSKGQPPRHFRQVYRQLHQAIIQSTAKPDNPS